MEMGEGWCPAAALLQAVVSVWLRQEQVPAKDNCCKGYPHQSFEPSQCPAPPGVPLSDASSAC